MDNGFGNLADRVSALAVSDSPANSSGNNKDSLYQVMKAVEAAEATIRQQVEENDRLRVELQRKTGELEKFNELVDQRQYISDKWDEHAAGPKKSFQSISLVENNSVGSRMNGELKVLPAGQVPDNAVFSQFSSPSTTAFSPNRYQTEGDHDPRFDLSGHGMMAMADLNNSGSIWNQNREHEEEIIQLRKHLAEYSVKEAQIRSEKYVLEKRIAYMRMAFDQQQQDLVDAASKALSYRQDIIEENIRLTYALQDAQQERTTFVSSLLPLLTEYSLQPQVPDAQSIVSNLKVLFKHLQEKLAITETKLKESHYQLAPWRSDVNQSNFSPPSPSPSIGATLATSNNNGLELVPQPPYSVEKIPVSSSNTRTASEWDLLGQPRSSLGGFTNTNLETDEVGRYPHLASRNSAVIDVQSQLASTRADSHETSNRQVTFSDPVSTSEMYDSAMERQQNDAEPLTNWDSGNPSYTTSLDDPGSSYSPYLPAVPEEPSSSFSEAAGDDPLPAIEGLQISGEAFPGRELQASGYSINGTTSCNFEWVRHLENGSVNYIEGAKQPNYLVTADDVDAYLAIEVQPLDNRKRKGELVKVFANEHKKITCDPEMHQQIEKTLHSGHASYKVSLSAKYIDMWEPATLAVKREGYSIKCNAPSLGVTEKFSPTIKVSIPYGNSSEFSIVSFGGVEHFLRADSSTDVSCSRDTIVLTMRLFIIRATEKKKGKKKSLFFNK